MGELIPLRPDPTLWREVAGRRLRARRHRLGETLAQTAARAGVSTQYLSEVERGRKDPSSEILAAVAGALGLTLLDLTCDVARELQRTRSRELPRTISGGTGLPRGPLALAA